MKLTEEEYNRFIQKCYEERYKNGEDYVGLKLFNRTKDCICLEATLGREIIHEDENIYYKLIDPTEDGVYMTKIIRLGGVIDCRVNIWKDGDWMIHTLDGARVIAYREISKNELNKLFPGYEKK